jgi:Protein of unknown function (DUF642)/PEP-CTERM motif
MQIRTRASIAVATGRIMLAVLAVLSYLFIASRPVRAGNLIVNGSFESPSATSSGKIIEVFSGSEPAGFTWHVTSGTVEITQQGYVDPAGQVFAGPAFQGSQWLDLDGISPGAIAQAFATTPGTLYALSFAYANNPFRNNPSDSGDPSATVRLTDTATNDNLASLSISHDTSTGNNYDWTLSGPLQFVATGTSTTLSFVSNDAPESDEGVFLDGISVDAAVPEPSSFVLLGVAAVCTISFALGRRRLMLLLGGA